MGDSLFSRKKFAMGITVRDRDQANPSGVGFSAQDSVTITVGDAGPFVVRSQGQSSVQWLSGFK